MNSPIVAACAAISLAVWASAAQAKDEHSLDSPTYKRCMGATMANIEQRECIEDELARQTTAIGATYKTLMVSIADPAQKIELRDAEREWIKQKTKRCDNAGNDFKGGSEQQTVIDACLLSETEGRILYLRKLTSAH
jgi:uncharacterized protein YecT (DUF1311 family)